MTTTTRPVILGIDEDRANQGKLAQAFNAQGLFYRFITDRRKVQGGIKQLSPDILLVFGELSSDFVIQVLDSVAADVSSSTLPIIVVANDISDAEFVNGLRTNVVGLFPAPFDPSSVPAVKGLFDELPSRPGVVKGMGDAKRLGRLIDHIRRTRRAGALTIDPRTPNEGRAFFSRGKLERASFLGALGADALKAISNVPRCSWTFSEAAGQSGDGAGVVIEVGDPTSGETAIAEVVVGEEVVEDEPLAFEVSVARPPPPPPSAPPLPPTLTPEPMLPPGVQPIQLLLVDDDEAILRMFKTLFLKHGFKVSTATDGQLGFDVALSKQFDVVLADLNMPHLDGWGLLRLLREDFRTRELPIAFISAHDDYRESLKALNAGAQAYLSKGTRLDALVTQVKKLLEPRQAALLQIATGAPFTVQVAPVGPQWLLKRLEDLHASGRLDARDGWAVYSLFFTDGVCTHTSAQAGKFTASGERAFNAFIASKNAEATWTPGNGAAEQNLHLPTSVLIERACNTLNENERRMRESLMVTATEVDVHPELYAVYTQVGPKQWLHAAKLICEDKLAPRDIIARLEISPVDVEETMKDLIRRGVVSLKKS